MLFAVGLCAFAGDVSGKYSLGTLPNGDPVDLILSRMAPSSPAAAAPAKTSSSPCATARWTGQDHIRGGRGRGPAFLRSSLIAKGDTIEGEAISPDGRRHAAQADPRQTTESRSGGAGARACCVGYSGRCRAGIYSVRQFHRPILVPLSTRYTPNMGELGGTIALVTGASRGIAWAIALGLARAGADVGINYRARRKKRIGLQRSLRSWAPRRVDSGRRLACRRGRAAGPDGPGAARAYRHPGQQCRHRAAAGDRRYRRAGLERGDRVNLKSVLSGYAGGAARDAQAAVGTHRESLVGGRAGGGSRRAALRRFQGGNAGVDAISTPAIWRTKASR